MKSKFNYGSFVGDGYLKRVNFDKAVLWHTRQLSLRSDIISKIKSKGVKRIVFVDDVKKEKWSFKAEKVLESMVVKMEGQEEQCYFPIDLAKREQIQGNKANDYYYDKERNVYVLKGPDYVEPAQMLIVESAKIEPSIEVPLFS